MKTKLSNDICCSLLEGLIVPHLDGALKTLRTAQDETYFDKDLLPKLEDKPEEKKVLILGYKLLLEQEEDEKKPRSSQNVSRISQSEAQGEEDDNLELQFYEMEIQEELEQGTFVENLMKLDKDAISEELMSKMKEMCDKHLSKSGDGAGKQEDEELDSSSMLVDEEKDRKTPENSFVEAEIQETEEEPAAEDQKNNETDQSLFFSPFFLSKSQNFFQFPENINGFHPFIHQLLLFFSHIVKYRVVLPEFNQKLKEQLISVYGDAEVKANPKFVERILKAWGESRDFYSVERVASDPKLAPLAVDEEYQELEESCEKVFFFIFSQKLTKN